MNAIAPKHNQHALQLNFGRKGAWQKFVKRSYKCTVQLRLLIMFGYIIYHNVLFFYV